MPPKNHNTHPAKARELLVNGISTLVNGDYDSNIQGDLVFTGYQGSMKFVVCVPLMADGDILTITIQESDDQSSWSTLVRTADASNVDGVVIVADGVQTKKYIRAVVTTADGVEYKITVLAVY